MLLLLFHFMNEIWLWNARATKTWTHIPIEICIHSFIKLFIHTLIPLKHELLESANPIFFFSSLNFSRFHFEIWFINLINYQYSSIACLLSVFPFIRRMKKKCTQSAQYDRNHAFSNVIRLEGNALGLWNIDSSYRFCFDPLLWKWLISDPIHRCIYFQRWMNIKHRTTTILSSEKKGWENL